MQLITSYWRLGDRDELIARCAEAGLQVVPAVTRQNRASFGSVDQFVAAELDGTPLRQRISEAAYAGIVVQTGEALRPFATADDQLVLPVEGHILVARATR